MSYFLRLDGIDGDAIERGHENWITITGVSWGVSQSASTGGGGGGGGGAGRATFRPVVFTTLISAHTPELVVQCASGRHIARAEFEAVRDGEQPSLAWRWQFDEVLVTSLDLTGVDGDPALTQSLSVSYRTVRLTTFTQSPDGTGVTEIASGWDVAAASPV